MKSKIISILIGMGIMGVLVGCGEAVQSAQADENGYLKYCGEQSIDGYSSVIVYEDSVHKKVVYIGHRNGKNISVTVGNYDDGKR